MQHAGLGHSMISTTHLFFLSGNGFDGTTIPCIERQRELVPVEVETFAAFEQKLVALFKKYPDKFCGELRQHMEALLPGATDLNIMKTVFRDYLLRRFDRISTEIGREGPGDTVNFVVVAKETDGTILGFVEFNIQSEYPPGSVELDPLGVLPFAQGRGLSRLLAFSILKLWPATKKIFLGTLQHNKGIYTALGFKPTEDLGDLGIGFEYVV